MAQEIIDYYWENGVNKVCPKDKHDVDVMRCIFGENNNRESAEVKIIFIRKK
jgi:hypothetical protein